MTNKTTKKETSHKIFANKERTKLAFMRAIILCLVSLIFSGIFLTVVNDMYGFVKADGKVELTIPQGSALSDVSDSLGKAGVVKNPFAFTLYVRSNDKADELEKVSGEVTLDKSMSYRDILSAILKAKSE